MTNVETNTQTIGKDFSYGDVPALHPDVIVARVKEVYEKVLIGRSLIGVESIPSDSVSYIVEGDMTGAVDWITEEGGFPKVDFSYTKRAKVVRPYGVQFDVTMMERKWARITTVGRKLTRTVRSMRKFEDDMIFYDLINNTDKATFNGANWADTTTDPIADIEKAKRLVRDATEGVEADIIIMNSLMFENITKFDMIRNQLYNNTLYTQTGKVGRLCGLDVIVNNQIDPVGNVYHALVMKKGEAGYMAEAIPLTNPSIDGLSLSNPLLDRRYFMYAMAEPVIDNGETMCLITGLNA